MKKLVVVILICFVLTGCQTKEENDLRNKFAVTVYPTRIITEDGKKNILYSVSVDNESEEVFKNFYGTIVLNEELDQYIATGVVPLPFTKINLVGKSDPASEERSGIGVELNFQQILSDEQFMKEAEIDYTDILELGQDFILWLRWDGGEVKFDLTSAIIDESAD